MERDAENTFGFDGNGGGFDQAFEDQVKIIDEGEKTWQEM